MNKYQTDMFLAGSWK